MKTFYIASSLNNREQVRFVSNELVKRGYIHTYDWTTNKQVNTLEKLREIGKKEKEGVKSSDFVVVLLPGGKGTHIELGMAIAFEKNVFLYSPDRSIDDPTNTSTFYHLPELVKCFGSLDDLLKVIASEKQ